MATSDLFLSDGTLDPDSFRPQTPTRRLRQGSRLTPDPEEDEDEDEDEEDEDGIDHLMPVTLQGSNPGGAQKGSFLGARTGSHPINAPSLAKQNPEVNQYLLKEMVFISIYLLFHLRIRSPSTAVLKFQGYTSRALEGLLKRRWLTPRPGFQIQEVRGGSNDGHLYPAPR